MDRLTSVSNTAPSGQQQSMNSQIAAALGISEERVHVQDMQSLNATPDMQSIPGLQMLRAAGLQPTSVSPQTVQSSIPMTITYGDNGNILSKTGVGTYSYQSQKPHAVTGVENTSSLISTATQQATYNGFGKVESVTDNGYRMDFTYGPDNERWKTELYKNNVLRRTTVYAGDYEEVSMGSTTFGYCYLGDGVIALTVDGGTPYIGYAYTDNLGSILTAVSTDGTVVYNADYDAWGRQNVTSDYVGYHRGFCGHEMMPEFGLINMNGRLYDPALGRFLSPDNFVQMPDNSQSFNRYSYCLNNPLKYTDPSGELFGIDDAVLAFAIFNAASSMMQAAYNGQSVWKAGALSLLSSATSYGIGSAFGAVGGFGKEMLRAGAHGLAGGAISALGGGSFWSGFSSSALASGIGSFAQGVHMNQALMVASTTAMGGLGAWATGGDVLAGAMQGFNIGLLNHAMHDGNESIRYYHDSSGNLCGDIPEVVVRTSMGSNFTLGGILVAGSVATTFFEHNNYSRAFNHWRGKNGKLYSGLTGRGPNQHTGPRALAKAKALKYNYMGKIIGVISISSSLNDFNNSLLNSGITIETLGYGVDTVFETIGTFGGIGGLAMNFYYQDVLKNYPAIRKNIQQLIIDRAGMMQKGFIPIGYPGRSFK